jgi:uncharacterized membrane protein
MHLKLGHKSRLNLIYQCSHCDQRQVFLAGQQAHVCVNCGDADAYWEPTDVELITVSHDDAHDVVYRPNDGERISEAVMRLSGNIYFVYLHLLWFGGWIIYNMVSPAPFDQFPFGLLTMVVSLEAILLAIVILIAQNRQSGISELRAKLDYETDLQTRRETQRIKQQLKRVLEESGQDEKKE